MGGMSPGTIVRGTGGMQWWNPETCQWQAERPPPQTTCGGGLHPFRTGTLLTLPQDADRGDPTNGGDFVRVAATACNNTPYQYQMTAEPVGVSACDIPWPCLYPDIPSPFQPHQLLDQRRPVSANPDDWYHKISDADVDRIARRVAEILRQPPVDPDAQTLVDRVVAEAMPKPTKKRRVSRRR